MCLFLNLRGAASSSLFHSPGVRRPPRSCSGRPVTQPHLLGAGGHRSRVPGAGTPRARRAHTHLGVGLVHRGVRATAQALGKDETVQPRKTPAGPSHPAPAPRCFLVRGAGSGQKRSRGRSGAAGRDSARPQRRPPEAQLDASPPKLRPACRGLGDTFCQGLPGRFSYTGA